MLFEITRTSSWSGDPKVATAVKRRLLWVDRRSAARPEDIPCYARSTDEWFNFGLNHRSEDGCFICRDIEDEVWVVEVNTLEELLRLEETYGRLIVQKTSFKDLAGSIEVYDDYRE